MPPNCIGNKLLWTRDKVLDALRAAAAEIKGPLPCSDRKYLKLKTGRYDWPSPRSIYMYFGSMAAAWVAAGAGMDRVTFSNTDWKNEDIEYVRENAGTDTLKQIGNKLGRSCGAVRRVCYENNIIARGNQGWFSAAEISKEYNCPYHRVRVMLDLGILKGKYDHIRNRWEIDTSLITPDIEGLLRAPKKTHKTWPTDLGDYYKRYGIKRTLIDGKLVRVEGA